MGGVAVWAPHWKVPAGDNCVVRVRDGMKVHLRYHAGHSGPARLWVRQSNSDTIWQRPIAVKPNAWTAVEAPLSEFKTEGGAALPAGTLLQEICVAFEGEAKVYVDSLEVSATK